ncbi:hypothetical protein OSTOST_22034, partial [Ostertagia ostertagi]
LQSQRKKISYKAAFGKRRTGRHQIRSAIYGDRRELISYLCSRDAQDYRETMQGDKGTIYEELKIPHLYITDKNGYKRPYHYYGTVHAVEGDEFRAEVVKLNRFCNILPHGYVVRQEDFENQTEFEEVFSKV